MTPNEVRRYLLQFLDEHFFNPVLTAPLDRADRREELEDAQACSERLRRRYHERCSTAEELRLQFIADVAASSPRVCRELDRLGLPTLPGLRGPFLQLCDTFGVGGHEHASAF